MPALKISSWNAELGSRDRLVPRPLSPPLGPISTQEGFQPKLEAGSLVRFDLLFCTGRVFRGYPQRLQEHLGAPIPEILRESLLKKRQAALRSRLAARNRWWHGHYSRSACSDSKLPFLLHLLPSEMTALIKVSKWDCPLKRKSVGNVSRWNNYFHIQFTKLYKARLGKFSEGNKVCIRRRSWWIITKITF